MDKNKKTALRLNTMAVLLIVIFCAAITPVTLQNDTFYTIEIGEYILENGITNEDPFSWHENLSYTFPHWLYDVMTYLIYNIGGMTGIYISTIAFTAILGIVLYFVNVKLIKNKIISFLLTIGTMYLMKPYICARAQLVTFILFILTIYFIERFLETKKIRYAIGLFIIPVLIANLHVATFYFYFILYLPYFAEYAIYILAYCNVIISQSVVDSINNKIKKQGETPELVEKLNKAIEKSKRIKEKQDKRMKNSYKIQIEYKPNTKYLIIIFIICLFTGLLTPLGETPYTYLIKTMQGISTKNINEHLPVILANDVNLLAALIVYVSMIAFTRTKIRFNELCLFGGLTILAIYTRRQESMLFLLCVLILNRLISEIMLKYNPKTINTLEKLAAKLPVVAIISTIIITISILQYKPKNEAPYIDESSYPVQAAEWIKQNLDIENIKLYNEYNYGSYLLYQDIPVFVDSRCDLYMPEFNEGVYVFRDFLNMNGVSLNNMEEKINEYGFTHFILLNSTKLKTYLEERTEQYKKIYPTDEIEDKYFTIYEKI